MKTGEELYNERMARIKKALALEKPDRTPIYLSGPAFVKFGNPSAVMADIVWRPEWADNMVVKAYESMPEIDAGSGASMGNMKGMGTMWMSKTKLPGRELPKDALWQIDEVGLMTEEDYDAILNKGWKAFAGDFYISRLGYTPEDLAVDPAAMQVSAKKYADIGLVSLMGAMGGFPYDTLSSGRGISKFTKDLYHMPGKVKAVLDVITEEMAADMIAMSRMMPVKPFMTMIAPGVRANCDFLSRKKFEIFAWPLWQKFTNIALEEGEYVFFHQDSRWDDFLDFFTEFPKQRCIYDLDNMTDIYKVKEVLGDRMCITGNASPALTTVGTPDENYNYTRQLINDIGPSGFIMGTACSVPPNAKLENIEAIIAACTGK